MSVAPIFCISKGAIPDRLGAMRSILSNAEPGLKDVTEQVIEDWLREGASP